MNMSEYSEMDAVELGQAVRAGEVAPGELLDAAIERAERHNPALNAITHKAYDEARARADTPLPDGPFKGVPFLIKDIACPVAGWPQTSGSRFLAGETARLLARTARRRFGRVGPPAAARRRAGAADAGAQRPRRRPAGGRLARRLSLCRSAATR